MLHVSLVANEDARDVILSELLHFAHPRVHRIERVSVRDVVDHNNAMGSLVVGGSDRFKALLASSVPNLQLAHFLVRVNRANLKVHTDRRLEILLELVISKTQEQT